MGVSEANVITQFAEGEPKKNSRKVREVRKVMEGGNEASATNEVTQFAEGEPKKSHAKSAKFAK